MTGNQQNISEVTVERVAQEVKRLNATGTEAAALLRALRSRLTEVETDYASACDEIARLEITILNARAQMIKELERLQEWARS
jgi:hypothetical protein